jgi:hypothetical protein
VSYFRFSIDLKAIDQLLHVTIGSCYSFMLTKMFGPRIQHEAFNKKVALRRMFIASPSECPITPSLAREVCDALRNSSRSFARIRQFKPVDNAGAQNGPVHVIVDSAAQYTFQSAGPLKVTVRGQ